MLQPYKGNPSSINKILAFQLLYLEFYRNRKFAEVFFFLKTQGTFDDTVLHVELTSETSG